jgi:hypothetical protein
MSAASYCFSGEVKRAGGSKEVPLCFLPINNFATTARYSRSWFGLTFRKPSSTADNPLVHEANLQDSLDWDPSQKGSLASSANNKVAIWSISKISHIPSSHQKCLHLIPTSDQQWVLVLNLYLQIATRVQESHAPSRYAGSKLAKTLDSPAKQALFVRNAFRYWKICHIFRFATEEPYLFSMEKSTSKLAFNKYSAM